MAKILRCGNCKGYITQQELERRKPPVHPWRLTTDGERIARENEHLDYNPQCPECGNRTFVFTSPTLPNAG